MTLLPMIKLFGGRALGWLLDNWTWMVPLLALLGLAWSWHGRGQRIEVLEARVAAVGAEMEAKVAACAAAGAQAMADQALLRQKEREDYVAKADAADDRYRQLAADYRMRVAQMRAGVPARPAERVGAPDGAGGAEGAGAGAVLSDRISVSIVDVEICAENTAKARIAHEWVAGMAGE